MKNFTISWKMPRKGSKMNIRDTFIADPGHIMLFIDLSRVEDRIVQMYSGIWAQSQRMIDLARSRDIDTHAQNAMAIMANDRYSEIEINGYNAAYKTNAGDAYYKTFKSYRQKAKKVTHGVQRALGAAGLSTQFFKDGFVISPQECQKMINAYLDANPEIRDYYFPFVQEMVKRYGYLENPFGRRIWWRHALWNPSRCDNALFRKAYSFLPQSTTADLINQQGVIAVDEWLERNEMKSYLIAQIHDEIVISCPYDEACKAARFAVSSLENMFYILGEPLSVPADLSVGKTWGGKKEMDRGCLSDNVMFFDKLREMGMLK